MTDITLTPAQFATLLDLLGTADTGEQEYNLTMNLTAKLLLLRMSGGGAPAPVASFTVLNDYATNVLKVNFTDTSTGTPTSWLWDFGDGATSTLQNPTHTYAAAGHYDVTLTATNGTGSSAPVVVSVPVNAFEAALQTAGFARIYQNRATSGTTATNTGSDGAGGNGTIDNAPTLGVADVTGNPDALSLTAVNQVVNNPAKILSSVTIVALIKRTTSVGATVFRAINGDGSQITFDTANGGAGSISFGIVNAVESLFAFVISDAGILAADTWYLVFGRYNDATGACEIRYSDDGTIKTPSIVYDDSPLSIPIGSSDYTTITTMLESDGATFGAVAYTSAFLSDAALLPIAAAVFP